MLHAKPSKVGKKRIQIRNPLQVTKAVNMPQRKRLRVSLLLWKKEPDEDIMICSPQLRANISKAGIEATHWSPKKSNTSSLPQK